MQQLPYFRCECSSTGNYRLYHTHLDIADYLVIKVRPTRSFERRLEKAMYELIHRYQTLSRLGLLPKKEAPIA